MPADKHDFVEYSHAAHVIKDFPKIIMVYEKLLASLYNYAQYTGVWHVITAVEESKFLLEMQYRYYKEVYDKKGLVDDRKTKTTSRQNS